MRCPLQQRDGIIVTTEAGEDATKAEGGAVVVGVALKPALQEHAGLARLTELFVAAGGIGPGLGGLEAAGRLQRLAAGKVHAADLGVAPGSLQSGDEGVALAGGDGLADQPMQGVDVAHLQRHPDGGDDVTGQLEGRQGRTVLEEGLVDDGGAGLLTVMTQGSSGGGVLPGGQQALDLGLDVGLE